MRRRNRLNVVQAGREVHAPAFEVRRLGARPYHAAEGLRPRSIWLQSEAHCCVSAAAGDHHFYIGSVQGRRYVGIRRGTLLEVEAQVLLLRVSSRLSKGFLNMTGGTKHVNKD